jgi:non-ribosomal peptide synthetase component F
MCAITQTTVHVTHRRIRAEGVNSTISPIGKPHSDLSASPHQDGTEVEPGQIGEICVAGPGLARGYRNDAEATARALRSAAWVPGDLRPTYLSGDLGRLTPEATSSTRDARTPRSRYAGSVSNPGRWLRPC